ncbi:MAG: SpaH/EbpB family LPXTG-anchored major pilin [Ruminococcus sp.]|uniref:SpaH/EbpB family LPXTG-anchored major pilin n=1 Tax=Ruminococcus sp. TaxID=41978 RepID=UPI002873D705|nr:SpaH/EbpB family LPXTG-anchored major pilin [Ruminococcus sp.]MBQ3285788.1 SpaH/EbpB family LPXTG-anchored major pilin [Ruminococcus sp.]
MTTLKRIMAVVLAVMLVASIAVFSASAEGEKLTINGKDNFIFDVYKVASFKGETTGGYDVVSGVDAAVKTYIETPGNKVAGKTFLETMDAATNPGTKVATLQTGSLSYTTTAPGIYYVKYVDYTGSGEAEITKNSVIVWPEYKSSNSSWDYKQTSGAYTIDLGNKTSSEYITKYFAGDPTLDIDDKVVEQGEIVDFVLEANVAGSTDNKLDKFEIWDKMCPGLEYNNDIAVHYDAVDAAATTDFDAIAVTNSTETDTAYKNGTKFTISAKAATLSGDAFYSHTKVFVTYSATVKNTALTGSAGNPNKDGLTYKFASESQPKDKDGREVTVFTASLKAKKINGNTDAALEGAQFALYKVSATAETKIAEGTSGADGNIIFKKDSADTESIKLGVGSYKVVETAAAPGFAKTTAEYTFSIDETYAKTGTAIFEVKDSGKTGICNYPTKLPETGGMGTTLFYVIGGCLVLFAGAMFVIIMKKKSSSK